MLGSEAGSAAQAPWQHWLRVGDWARLQHHFAQHPPDSAEAFAARGLMRVQTAQTAAQRQLAIEDLRQAAALDPANPYHGVNLAQALLDQGCTGEALPLAAGLARRLPEFLPALEKQVLALHAAHRWAEARAVLVQAQALARARRQTLAAPLPQLAEQLASGWWQPLGVGPATLRLPTRADLDSVVDWFTDAAFMARFHRFQPTSGSAAADWIDRAQRPPLETGRRDWIVQDAQGRPSGLAGLVDIDPRHARGELLLGLPHAASPTLALSAALGAMHFAFARLGLTKLVSHVYGDKPAAQANTLHLGFRQDGLLREHLLSDGRRIDLFCNSLLAREYAADPRLQRLRQRWDIVLDPL